MLTLTLESWFESPIPAATKPEGSQDAPLESVVQDGAVEVLLVSAFGAHEESTRKPVIPNPAMTDFLKKAELRIIHPPTLRV